MVRVSYRSEADFDTLQLYFDITMTVKAVSQQGGIATYL